MFCQVPQVKSYSLQSYIYMSIYRHPYDNSDNFETLRPKLLLHIAILSAVIRWLSAELFKSDFSFVNWDIQGKFCVVYVGPIPHEPTLVE